MDTAQVLLIVCVVIFTAVAAVCDARTKKLPNVLTVPALAAALLFHAVRGGIESGFLGVGQGLLFALGGFATGFGILLVLWLIGGGGGGDVKLMGALGAWLGALLTLQVFVVSTLFVVVGSVGVLAWKACQTGIGSTKRRYLDVPETSTRKTDTDRAEAAARRQRRRLMPFGVPVALATWSVLLVAELKDVIFQG